MLVDMIRSALGRDAQILSTLYGAEASMAQALEALRFGDIAEAEDFLAMGLMQLDEFWAWVTQEQ